SSVINIANTVLGSGMLAMPAALASVGMGLGMIMIALFSSFSIFGLTLLATVAARVGRQSSFFACAQITYPNAAFFFDLAIAVKCFGVSISYLVIVGSLMPIVVGNLSPELIGTWWSNRSLWITIFLVGMSPFAFLRRLDSLRYTSALALTAVVYLVYLVSYFYIAAPEGLPPHLRWSEIQWFRFDPGTFFTTLPIFVFAFTCHQNIFAIFNELRDNSKPQIRSVIGIAITTAHVVYQIVAVLGYLTFGPHIGSNLISQYPMSNLVIGAQLSMCLLVGLSIPLQIHPARASVLKCLGMVQFSSLACIAMLDGPTLGPAAPELDDHGSPVAPHVTRSQWTMTTLALLTGAFLIAISVQNLSFVLSIVGATGSTTICYILPGMFYHRL
ncbi:hypothetical protein CXG81DRAFT_5267, partial [Caulochytrium protostelioides]